MLLRNQKKEIKIPSTLDFWLTAIYIKKMSLRRIAVISAVSAHNSQRNRTAFYYDRMGNDTMPDPGLNFQQHFNILVGG